MSRTANRPLILGVGNPHRGDDAAGVLVARRLRDSGIPAREHAGETFSLLEEWSRADHVILIDAVVTGAPAGRITEWDAATAPVVNSVLGCSTHAFGVAEAIEMARALDRLPSRLRIFGIEGTRFGLGSGPSPEVLEAVEHLAQRICTLSWTDFRRSCAFSPRQPGRTSRTRVAPPAACVEESHGGRRGKPQPAVRLPPG